MFIHSHKYIYYSVHYHRLYIVLLKFDTTECCGAPIFTSKNCFMSTLCCFVRDKSAEPPTGDIIYEIVRF